jgi:signal transduction histidine kinase
MKDQYGLEVKVEIGDNFSQTEESMRVLLFQAVRELLFNVVKHAGTQQATVRLEQENDRRRVTVSDLGTGFDAEAIMKDPRSAHGLLIIKDRLALMGCPMQIQSKPGVGTQVKIEFPVEKLTKH